MNNRFSYLFLLIGLLLTTSQSSLFAQDKEDKLSSAQELCLILVSKIEVPEINYAPIEPPKYWTNGMLNQVGFSQVSLTNWAEGGSGSIAMNAYIDAHANYKKDLMIWENRFQFSYGFIQTLGEQFKKSDDKVILSSKWGYKSIDRLYFSALFNFRTQFTPGFSYSGDTKTRVSQLLAPGYISLGIGVDYNPFKSLSINLAPVTGNLVIVTNPELRKKYGNAEDEAVRKEFGAQLKAEFKKSFKNIKIGSILTLFSDFLKNPENIQVAWDVNINMSINKFLAAAIRTNLIYDKNILIADKAGNLAPRVQFKENFSLNFTYTFGNYQKQK